MNKSLFYTALRNEDNDKTSVFYEKKMNAGLCGVKNSCQTMHVFEFMNIRRDFGFTACEKFQVYFFYNFF